MRLLLCTGDGGGNIPPFASLAGELVGRGHTVRVLAGPYYPGGPESERATYREAAQKLAQKLQAEDGAMRAADELEAVGRTLGRQ
jgi:UDP:flavonoid glycosyltransferase YjiC (YdhE family)